MTNLQMVVVGLLLFAPGYAQGQETPLGHLKKDHPNELHVLYSEGETCGGFYERIVNNELIRSRIKNMGPNSAFDVPFLWVGIACTPSSVGNGIIFNIDVSFLRMVRAWNRQPNELSWTLIAHSPGYGKHGFVRDTPAERERYISNILRQCVEDALSDYLRINFDL